MGQRTGRHTPYYDPEGALTTLELIFIQNLAAEAGYDSTQVVLRDENWQMDVTPTGTVNGSNLVFTLPADASQAVVYADGMRVKGGGIDYTHTTDTDTITFVSGRQPFSSISVDYLPTII